MTVRVVELMPAAVSCKGLVGKMLTVFVKLSARTKKLDLEVMPDRVKRDLGLLDGREPRYEDNRLR